jgi:hypothetical protein
MDTIIYQIQITTISGKIFFVKNKDGEIEKFTSSKDAYSRMFDIDKDGGYFQSIHQKPIDKRSPEYEDMMFIPYHAIEIIETIACSKKRRRR